VAALHEVSDHVHLRTQRVACKVVPILCLGEAEKLAEFYAKTNSKVIGQAADEVAGSGFPSAKTLFLGIHHIIRLEILGFDQV